MKFARPLITLITAAALSLPTAHAEIAYGTGVELGTEIDNTVGVPVTVNFGASRAEAVARGHVGPGRALHRHQPIRTTVRRADLAEGRGIGRL